VGNADHLAYSSCRGGSAKRDKLLQALRASDRVKASVKEKSDDELLDHYQLAQGQASPTWACSALAVSIIAPN
jgi:hypothetical protein